MKKSVVVIALALVMVLSACGAESEVAELPTPAAQETTNVTKYTSEDNIIQQLLNATSTTENFTSSFDEENQIVTYVYHFDSALDDIKLAAELAPETYENWASQMQDIAEAAQSALTSNGITTVQTYLNVVDEDNNVFMTYHNGEKVIDLINFVGDNQPSTTSEPATIPETIVYTGTGDSVIEVGIASSDDIYVLHVTGNAADSHFAVKGYDSTGSTTELFVNTTDPYDGYTFDPSFSTSILEITATGEWTIELISILNMQTISSGQTINGTGDSVMLVGEYGLTATISGNQGASHFAVKTYGTESNDLLVNTTDPYDGMVVLSGDPVILQVNAKGEWTITFN